MSEREVSYVDFHLQVAQADEKRLLVSARCEAAGESKDEPVPPAELARLLKQVGHSFPHRLDQGTAESLGKAIWRTFLRSSIAELFTAARAAGRGDGLRILVSLPSGGGPLHGVPWELLHDGKQFLAKEDLFPVVRYLRVDEPPAEPIPLGRVNILLTTASPSDTPPLELDQEVLGVRKALVVHGERVDLKVFRDITLDQLEHEYERARNLRRPYHIWHHSGHGAVADDGECELVLHNAAGASHKVRTSRLDPLISQNRSLRLALLNVCFGGAEAGLAARLATLNVPQTIGFSVEIGDRAAIDFARFFYCSLAANRIETAVVQARRRMVADGREFDWARVMHFARTRQVVTMLREETRKEDSTTSGERRRFTTIYKGVKDFKLRTTDETQEGEGAEAKSLEQTSFDKS